MEMLFNSYLFLLLFLPLCLAGFYLLEKRGWGTAAKLWLLGFSLWFYGYFDVHYLGIMLGSIAFNFCIYKGIGRALESALAKAAQKGRSAEDGAAAGRQETSERAPSGEKKASPSMAAARLLLAVGVCGDLGLLFYFKYFDFFLENVNALFSADFALHNVLLPLGISFFTFQQIGFLADTYHGQTGSYTLRDYALFVAFFPQLVAGPIVSCEEMMPQFSRIGRRAFRWGDLTRGLYLFTLGLAKKVLLADTLGTAVNYGYENVAALSGTDALLVILFYTLQLYFDFSGYCDMARGLAHMMGLEIPVNFASPYKADSPVEFWKRWHITLTRFLRRYVYIPLGGNRRGTFRMLLNLFLVFLVSGLWHGAGWNFIVWGALHGAVYVGMRLLRLYGKEKKERREPFRRIGRALRVAATFVFINITWVFFRAGDLAQARQMFGRIAAGGFGKPSVAVSGAFQLGELWYVIKLLRLDRLPGSDLFLCAAFTLVSLVLVFFVPNAGELEERFTADRKSMFVTAVLFLWCVLSLSGVSTFLYFNF